MKKFTVDQKVKSENSLESESQQFDDRKEHYETLITLFKYTVSLFTVIFGVIGVTIGFITYSDGKEMRSSLKEQEKKLQESLVDLNTKELEMQKSLLDLIKETREEVFITGQRAIGQIRDVREESTSIAKIEAKKRIEQVFDEHNIEDFIAQVAKERLEPQVEKIVSEKISNFQQVKFDKALKDMVSVEESKHELALLYFQNTDPSEWSDEQLRKVIHILDSVENKFTYTSDVCIYLGLTQSPLVKKFFETKLIDNPHGDIGEFAFYYLIRNNGVNALSSYLKIYEKYQLESRPNFYFRIIQASSGNKSLTMDFLNNHEIVDLLFRDTEHLEKYKKNSMLEIRASIEDLLKVQNRNYDEYKNTYFFTKK